MELNLIISFILPGTSMRLTGRGIPAPSSAWKFHPPEMPCFAVIQ